MLIYIPLKMVFKKLYGLNLKNFTTGHFPIVLLISGLLHSQDIPLRSLDLSKGLSNNSVNAIYQDINGLMWFGSYDGLNRFDGYECKIYRNIIGDSLSLRNNNINCLEGDCQNNIWIGGYNGVSVLDQKTGAFHPIYYGKQNVKPLSDIVYKIEYFSNEIMLIGTQNKGLIACNTKTRIGKTIPLKYKEAIITNYDVSAIEANPKENFSWVFVNKVGLCKYKISKGTLEFYSSDIQQAHCIFSDENGIWIGSDNGLFLLKNKSISKNYMPEKCMVISLFKSNDSALWVGTDGLGVFKLFPNKDKAQPFSKNKKAIIKSNSIKDIFQDNTGNLWLSTLRGGVFIIAGSGTNFQHIIDDLRQNNIPEDNFIVSFSEDVKHNVWIGTDGAGLKYWNRRTNDYTRYNTKQESRLQLSSNYIPSLITTNDNNVWLATWGGGINRIDPEKQTIKYYHCYNGNTAENEENVWLIYKDRKNTIWASTARNGHLFKYNPDIDDFELFIASPLDLGCLEETTDGNLWAGNNTSLLHINTRTKDIKTYKVDYPVRSIKQAGVDCLWVGTDEGGLLLYNIKTKKYKRYTVTEGLPSNTILKIIRDSQGLLWLSTYNGLCRFDTKNTAFRNFSSNDGLQSNQFSYNSGLRLASGEILFGGINGFNIFNPEQLKDRKIATKIIMTGISIDNKAIEQNPGLVTKRDINSIKALELPYEQSNLSLDFTALDFTTPDKTQYAYYLEGWDKGWNFSGKAHKANYTRLMEGTYIFKVKTTDEFGRWKPALSLLTVTVLPPWYRTPLAYLIYVLCFLALIYLYIRYVKNKQKLHYEVKIAKLESRREKELAEKQLTAFTYITHEFRTPLSLIINPIQQSIRDENEGMSLRPFLLVAHRNARRLLSLVDQLLIFRQAEDGVDTLTISEINVSILCLEVFKCFEQEAKDRAIKYESEILSENTLIYGDYQKLEIVLFNLLSNAFKFTSDDNSIKLTVKATETEIVINVSDTGCGIEEDKRESVFDKFYRIPSKATRKTGFGIGLYVVKQFIEKHNGTITCISSPEKGTTFTVVLKRGNAHFAGLSIGSHQAVTSRIIEELQTVTYGPSDHKIEVTIDEEIITHKRSLVIVEDDTEMRDYITGLFSENYLVYSTHNGTDGLELIKQTLPDIVISDINMEPMDGLTLCQLVKQTRELSHIPFILLTAATKHEMQLKGINNGADDYITKPFENQILMAKVETLLKNRNQLRNYFLDSITLKENNQKVPAEYSNFLKQCITVIESNLDREDFNIKDFSKQMGMSHSSLYKKIKVISGQTTNAFIRSVRLRRAAVLMLTENITIGEAGSKVGIGDPRYFRRQFALLFGITPSEYIKKYRHSFNKELNVIQKEQ